MGVDALKEVRTPVISGRLAAAARNLLAAASSSVGDAPVRLWMNPSNPPLRLRPVMAGGFIAKIMALGNPIMAIPVSSRATLGA
ncbi:MAG: hypothetical protein BWY82_00925 [Verrucomicrobia bacterium ADurb.Bin474]|nr:MAG: hypothetical protein BWY82_00925 [Verrucomicrobia bacterium ADurb.Bin474]